MTAKMATAKQTMRMALEILDKLKTLRDINRAYWIEADRVLNVTIPLAQWIEQGMIATLTDDGMDDMRYTSEQLDTLIHNARAIPWAEPKDMWRGVNGDKPTPEITPDQHYGKCKGYRNPTDTTWICWDHRIAERAL